MERPSHEEHDTSTNIDTDQESDQESSMDEYDIYQCAGDGSDCLGCITQQTQAIIPFRGPSGMMGPAQCSSELSDLCDFNFALHRYNDNLQFVVQHYPFFSDSARRDATLKLHNNCVSCLGPAMIKIIDYVNNRMEDENDCEHCTWKVYFQYLADVQRLMWEALISLARVDELIFSHGINRAVPKSAKPSLDSAWLLRDEALSWFVAETNQLKTPYLRTCNKTMSMISYAPPPHHSLPQAIVSFKLRATPESVQKEIVSLKAIESHINHDNPVCGICHDPIDPPNSKVRSISSDGSMRSACCKKRWHAECLALWFREAISKDCCPLCRKKWSKDAVSRPLEVYFTWLREELKKASIAREQGQQQTPLRQQSILAYIDDGRKPLQQASLFPYVRGNPTRNLKRTVLQTCYKRQVRITQLVSVIRKTRRIAFKGQASNMLTQTSILRYFHGKRRPLRQRLISSFLITIGGNATRH